MTPVEYIEGLFSGLLAKMLIAILIFLLGFIIGKLLGKLIYKVLHELEFNKFIKNTTGLKLAVEEGVSLVVTYTTYFFSLVVALDQIGLTNIIFYMIAASILIIIILSFFLGLKDILPNIMAGFTIHQNIRRGDTLFMDNFSGTIERIDLIQTKIITKGGDVIYVPNALFIKSKIKLKKNLR